MSITYYVVTEHPGTGGQGVDYVCDRRAHQSRSAARRAGCDELFGDDFCIAEVANGLVVKYDNPDVDMEPLAKAIGINTARAADLPVGTYIRYADRDVHPRTGVIVGYDDGHTKCRVRQQLWAGLFGSGDTWVFPSGAHILGTIDDCTHGGDCTIHPGVGGVHNFDSEHNETQETR